MTEMLMTPTEPLLSPTDVTGQMIMDIAGGPPESTEPALPPAEPTGAATRLDLDEHGQPKLNTKGKLKKLPGRPRRDGKPIKSNSSPPAPEPVESALPDPEVADALKQIQFAQPPAPDPDRMSAEESADFLIEHLQVGASILAGESINLSNLGGVDHKSTLRKKYVRLFQKRGGIKISAEWDAAAATLVFGSHLLQEKPKAKERAIVMAVTAYAKGKQLISRNK